VETLVSKLLKRSSAMLSNTNDVSCKSSNKPAYATAIAVMTTPNMSADITLSALGVKVLLLMFLDYNVFI
jgi:hypothetical protein